MPLINFRKKFRVIHVFLNDDLKKAKKNHGLRNPLGSCGTLELLHRSCHVWSELKCWSIIRWYMYIFLIAFQYTGMSCDRPVIKGATTKSNKRRYHRGDRLMFRCQSGGPSSTLICQANGKWTGPIPVCNADQCRISCQNGGSCTSDNKCTCPPGYSGHRCQHG